MTAVREFLPFFRILYNAESRTKRHRPSANGARINQKPMAIREYWADVFVMNPRQTTVKTVRIQTFINVFNPDQKEVSRHER
jgi:hypothetical protein